MVAPRVPGILADKRRPDAKAVRPLRQSTKTILIWLILIVVFVSVYNIFTDSSSNTPAAGDGISIVAFSLSMLTSGSCL